MNAQRGLTAFASVILIFAMAACDFSPSAPFAGFDEESGATLNGRFQSGVATSARGLTASGYGAQRMASADSLVATAVIVYVNGVEFASVDIVNGAFTLRGLPESFTLQFVDAGGASLGEPIEFAAVKPNQEIDIVVDMVGGQVVIVEESRTGIDHEGSSGIEIEGPAGNIVIDSLTNPMTGSLDVNGYHVLTRAGETSIRKGNRSLTLADLSNGDKVHVRGVFEGDDVFAFEIKLQEEEEETDDGQVPVCDWTDPAKPNHILICHKGSTKSVSPNAWPGHYGHGDKCGPC